MNKEDILFPFDSIRFVQDDLIKSVDKTIKKGENLIVHAPTGLGKTISALGPALKTAQEKDLTVFFLTSRHTQHKIAIDTIRAIKEKYNLKIPVVDIIGKKWMCLIEGTNFLNSGEFFEYCKKSREDKKCKYYNNLRNEGKLSLYTRKTLEDAEEASPLEVEEIVSLCKENNVCPYEISLLLSKKAKVIIADYYYLFNPSIMKNFFNRTNKEIEECIVIVDEAHNLPDRIRNLMSVTISDLTLKSARKEARENLADECYPFLDLLEQEFKDLIEDNNEIVVNQGEFNPDDFENAIDLFEDIAEKTREKNKRSSLGAIANFLLKYSDEDGFVNIIRNNRMKRRIEFKHSCLDPSLITKPIFNNSYASIIMSGTLEPVRMYKEVLGVTGDAEEFPSPFPAKNKLSMIVPETTTKFSERSDAQFQKIGENLAKMCNAVPGNSIIFFPSYLIRDKVYQYFADLTTKTVFNEVVGMTKEEKESTLERFKTYKKTGAVLLAVASGSFGEGIDLPGDELKCVIVVGLPLNKPDLETNALINYYNKIYGNGWDYGYVLPALSKVLQNAGRCIRSETDKGVIIFMDKRYVWENYKKCFTEDYEVSLEYERKIKEFFN